MSTELISVTVARHRCCDCGCWKDATQFRSTIKRRPNGKGVSSYCIECLRERWRRWAGYGARVRRRKAA